tara:strand:- start:669 stop:890 length:222 start_codon:yes stop_codon:yes gene_type:complete
VSRLKLFFIIFAIFFVFFFLYLLGLGQALGGKQVALTSNDLGEVMTISLFCSVVVFGVIILYKKVSTLLRKGK